MIELDEQYIGVRPIDFVGDLSIQDAKVLLDYASKAQRILEFGVGGSTQIFAQCNPSVLLSVETDEKWAQITKDKIASDFPNATPPLFMGYTTNFLCDFDLVFVDGIGNKRFEFALNTWRSLRANGCMLFHDTRRANDFANVMRVAQNYYEDLEHILVNTNDSNITVLKKRFAPLKYENWNFVEGLPQSAYNLMKANT
jgi:predicted O-methyltransferase YrrM